MAYQDDEIITVLIESESDDIDEEYVGAIVDLMVAGGIVSVQRGSHDEVQAQYERYGTIH